MKAILPVSKFKVPLAALLLPALLGSCAYFNTLYNARRTFKEAEEAAESGPIELPTIALPLQVDLEQAFGVFNELSERLTTAYGQLEARVALLTEELASSRRERLSERAEKEHLADQLGVLLEALPAAVVLVQWRGETLLRRGLLIRTEFQPGAQKRWMRSAAGRPS